MQNATSGASIRMDIMFLPSPTYAPTPASFDATFSAVFAMPKPASVNSSKEFAVSLLANDAFTSLVEASMRPCYCAAVGVRRRKIGQI